MKPEPESVSVNRLDSKERKGFPPDVGYGLGPMEKSPGRIGVSRTTPVDSGDHVNIV